MYKWEAANPSGCLPNRTTPKRPGSSWAELKAVWGWRPTSPASCPWKAGFLASGLGVRCWVNDSAAGPGWSVGKGRGANMSHDTTHPGAAKAGSHLLHGQAQHSKAETMWMFSSNDTNVAHFWPMNRRMDQRLHTDTATSYAYIIIIMVLIFQLLAITKCCNVVPLAIFVVQIYCMKEVQR